jgi:hypothetical protein
MAEHRKGSLAGEGEGEVDGGRGGSAENGGSAQILMQSNAEV